MSVIEVVHMMREIRLTNCYNDVVFEQISVYVKK